MFCLYFLLSFLTLAEGYKIAIIISDVSGSQILFCQRVAEILADAGHNVTLFRLRLLNYKDVKANTRSDIQEYVAYGLKDDPENLSKFMQDQIRSGFKNDNPWTMLTKGRKEYALLTQYITDSCGIAIQDKELIHRLQNEKFDIVMAHAADFCPVGLVHVTGNPAWVVLNSAPLFDHYAHYMGLTRPASYAPPIVMDAGDKMSFGQRFKSIIGHTITPWVIRKIFIEEENKHFKKTFGENFPDLEDVAKTAQLIFVNTNDLYDLPKPQLSKIINIGGLGVKPINAKPLPKEYSELVDKAESVVVFSFGSIANASWMSDEWKHAFMGAFANFPKTQFFMRYSTNDMDDYKPENVFLTKWLPQNDLLHNKKTKVLITHGGYNSMQEAINSGTCLLTLPLFGDQFRNGRAVEKHHLGLVLEKSDVNLDGITKHLKTLLENQKFEESVLRMQKMVEKQPISPEQKLIKWTEFLAEFKTLENLKPVGADLDFITFYNIDVYVTMLLVIVTIIGVTFLFIRFVFKKLFGLFRQNKSKKD